MKNYVYIYYNEGTAGAPTEEVTKAWGEWFGSIGQNLVDGGNPFAGNGKAVEKSGVSDIENWPATGYSIVKAESIDQAAQWAKGCPVLDEPKGAVRVYETMPM